MPGKPYIPPAKESEVMEWSGNLLSLSGDNKTLWGLPEDKRAELQTLHREGRVKRRSRSAILRSSSS
jgi:hypothetical protein